MKGYDSYKNSGIDWIGKIPKEWRISKLKFVTAKIPYPIVDGPFGTQLKAEEYQESGIPLVRISNLDYNCNLTLEDIKFISDEKAQEIKRSAIRLNDIIIGKTGATIGKSGLNDKIEFGIISSSCLKISIDEKIITPYFLKYFVISNNFQKIILQTASGSTRDTINITPMANLEVVIPSIQEQTQIAEFLDYKTNLIDATIEKKKRLIELLKEKRQAVINEAVTKGLNPNAPMKDSGVEWLGEIPINWDVVLMKRIIQSIKDGTHGTHERIIDGKPLLSAKNVFDNKLLINESESQISDEEHNKIVSNGFPKKNDILLSCVGTIGRSYVYDLDYPISFQRSVAFLRLKLDMVIPKYIKLMIESNLYQSQLMSFAKTSAQSGVYLGDIMKTVIVIPNISDQQKIVEFLDTHLYKIDNSILKIEIAIEKLQTYRQSLISEAVTGKIDVRDWQKPKNN